MFSFSDVNLCQVKVGAGEKEIVWDFPDFQQKEISRTTISSSKVVTSMPKWNQKRFHETRENTAVGSVHRTAKVAINTRQKRYFCGGGLRPSPKHTCARVELFTSKSFCPSQKVH